MLLTYIIYIRYVICINKIGLLPRENIVMYYSVVIYLYQYDVMVIAPQNT